MNRSEEIRRFFKENPSARPKECIIALAARGIEVTPTLVSCVRAKLKERDMGQDVALVRAFVESSGLDPEVAVEILGRFIDVAERVGGTVRFREVLAEIGPYPGGGADDDQDPVATPESPVAPEPTPTPTPVTGDAAFFYDDVNDEDDD